VILLSVSLCDLTGIHFSLARFKILIDLFDCGHNEGLPCASLLLQGGTGTDNVECARLEDVVQVLGAGGWRPVDNSVLGLGLVRLLFVSGSHHPLSIASAI